MATNLIRGDVVQVPLPSDFQNQACLPLVIMQPTADLTNYMLKSNYATNGRPGVVDHAVLADTANSVDWHNITSLPAQFPPTAHAPTHLPGGSDPIGLASILSPGLMKQGNNDPTQFFGGDMIFHPLPGTFIFRTETQANIDPSFSGGAVICQAIVPWSGQGTFIPSMFYVYDANQKYPPAGWVHFDIYDPGIPGWVQATDSTNISALNSQTAFIALVLKSAAMTRVFTAPANAFTWRLVLDTPAGTAAYFMAGSSFYLCGISTPAIPPVPGP